ncbi:HAD-superfamily subfamily IIA hydrolase, TIGR01458 [Persephonella hydrogeniphila]|uniref:Haloacid dehalogenase-like hydrolase domain-containing protein 2 n=1 Tax=Persephonella hydrogeniphila TaxID=198703 RepID=A0A285NGK5_9AQUI|nr:TIGR01458 family HAD-type hydrolase [Persephonella hydrogeniphila]SNZ08579.1 HAD-superfamily subfamily IIA hydrolase, TIGR01458 [Persephonella hydrogeniphila]
MIDFSKIKGLLLDLDGVLYIIDTPIEGAKETLKKLKERFKVRFITNTTTKPRKVVYQKLKEMGFDVEEEEIFSALEATKQFLKEKNAGAFLILTDLALEDMKDIKREPVEYVVVGDARDNFTYSNMNRAFRYLMEGAELIAAAKNKYFRDKDGKLSLDCGAFIVGLEFATGKKARLIGKPNKDFFLMAVKSMGLKPEEVAVVGDDIESDVKGGMDAGLKGILVKTGKFTSEDLKKGIKPDLVIEDINQLLDFIHVD